MCELWNEFKEYTRKKYIPHHAIAKWQRNSHIVCLDTFEDGELVMETYFIEKLKNCSSIGLTCESLPSITIMVAIADFSPRVMEGGGRVHTTETWIFASEDPSHDADFHHHALGQIADCY